MAKLLNVDSLKREAHETKKVEGIQHSTALNRIAAREGYRTWAELMREQNRLHRDDQDRSEDTQPSDANAHLSAYDQPTYLKAIFRH